MKNLISAFLLIASIQTFSQNHSCKDRHLYSGYSPIKKSTVVPRPFDLLHFDIELDFTAFNNQMNANAGITFKADSALSSITLHLLQLTVDSIHDASGISLTFTRTGVDLNIQLPPMSAGDTGFVRVYYSGNAATDASGWGGYYYAGGIIYNLGVGFASDPHSFGRAWHPCVDDFTERASYRLKVHTQLNHRAQCIGSLDSTTTDGTRKTHYWRMDEEIPAYLANFAVGPYEVVHLSHQGLLGNIPIELAARASDTTNVKNSFQNLGGAIDAYESAFGPYVWDKVGYVMTGQGAMEHPTNISYPLSIANGSLINQDIMAHELAHHWWGDLATCETEGDMWINEGIAEWSAHYFFEYVYNRDEYMSQVLTNHLNVLRTAHVIDNGFRALANMPHAYTYGIHAYYKGASTFHSLRGYFNNDALFFSSLQQLLQDFSLKSISTEQFRDSLSAISGIDLSYFWDNWIFEPGFAQVSVDSFSVQSTAGLYNVTLHLQQRLRATSNYYEQMPVEIRLTDAAGNDLYAFVTVDGQYTTATVQSAIEPVWIPVNTNGLLSLGTTFSEDVRSSTGNFGNGRVGMTTNIQSITDSIRIRVEHHWANPNIASTGGIRFSENHYWSVSGLDLNKATITANINFDRRSGNALLDADLLSVTEDSLALFYRPNASTGWTLYPHYVKNFQGNSANGFGRMELSQLLPGDYVFGNADPSIGLNEEAINQIILYPNPASGHLNIIGMGKSGSYEVVDVSGKVIQIGSCIDELRLDLSKWPAGGYFLNCNGETQRFEVVR